MRKRLLMACHAVSAAAGITLAVALGASGASAAVTGQQAHSGTRQCAAYKSGGHIHCVRRPARSNIQFWGGHIQFWGPAIQFWGPAIQFWGKNLQVRRDNLQFWGSNIQFWAHPAAR